MHRRNIFLSFFSKHSSASFFSYRIDLFFFSFHNSFNMKLKLNLNFLVFMPVMKKYLPATWPLITVYLTQHTAVCSSHILHSCSCKVTFQPFSQCSYSVMEWQMFLKLPMYLSASRNLAFWEMDRSDFGTETTNCALGVSERYLSKTDEIRLYMIDSDSRGDISAISLPIGNAPKSFSRWHKQTPCRPQLEKQG